MIKAKGVVALAMPGQQSITTIVSRLLAGSLRVKSEGLKAILFSRRRTKLAAPQPYIALLPIRDSSPRRQLPPSEKCLCYFVYFASELRPGRMRCV